MPETITDILVCERCEGEFDRPSPTGKRPKWCGPCAQERSREWKQEWRKAEKARASERPKVEEKPTTYTCRDCGGVFARPKMTGRLLVRCPECKARLRKAYSAISNARRVWVPKRPPPPALRRAQCKSCDAEVVWIGTGRAYEYCRPCWEVRNAQSKKDWVAANPERARILSRNAAKRRRARLRECETEMFLDIEIYERDRWKCCFCNMKIDSTLEWPDPMSVSLDHTIPVVDGGGHLRRNVKASHLQCNKKKGRRFLPQGEQLLLIG